MSSCGSLREWYTRGATGGEPPSGRFDALDGAEPDDLWTSCAAALLDLQAQRLGGWSAAWTWLCGLMAATPEEAAFLLGLLHDARPPLSERIPRELLETP